METMFGMKPRKKMTSDEAHDFRRRLGEKQAEVLTSTWLQARKDAAAVGVNDIMMVIAHRDDPIGAALCATSGVKTRARQIVQPVRASDFARMMDVLMPPLAGAIRRADMTLDLPFVAIFAAGGVTYTNAAKRELVSLQAKVA